MTKRAPKHFGKEARQFWKELADTYSFNSIGEWKLLQAMIESWDLQQTALKSIRDDGLVFPDRDGKMRKNPACQIEKDQKVLFFKGMAALCLDFEIIEEKKPVNMVGRPPGT